MFFKTYDNVPISLGTTDSAAKVIFATNSSISIAQPIESKIFLNDSIISFAGTGNIDFTADSVQKLLLGDYSGYGYPIPESVRSIPSGSEIRFPNCKQLYTSGEFKSGDYFIDVYSTGNLTLSGGYETQYGIVNPVRNYCTESPIAGTLDVTFYLSGQNIEDFFNVTGATGALAACQYPPINEERVTGSFGDWKFNHAYLKSLSFSAVPYQPIRSRASFDLYGSLDYNEGFGATLINSSDLKNQKRLPQGAASRVEGMAALASNYYPVSLDYNISVKRTPSFEIPSEADKDTTSGEIPIRVSKNEIIKTVRINGNKINRYLTLDGTKASLNIKLSDMGYDTFTDNNLGDLITFNCSGVIESQNLTIGAQDLLNGEISIKEHYR